MMHPAQGRTGTAYPPDANTTFFGQRRCVVDVVPGVLEGGRMEAMVRRRSIPVRPAGHDTATGGGIICVMGTDRIQTVIGPLATNLYVLADQSTREAIAIDTAIPCLDWISSALVERDWTLRLVISTHGHWDHTGDNAAVAEHTGASIAVHPLDRRRLTHPEPLYAPFPIPPCVPAVDLAEGGEIRFGEIHLRVLHTPGHTEGSVCLYDADGGYLYSGDTLFAGGWGRVDLPGGSPEAMADSLARLAGMDDPLRVMPGHGAATTIARERTWLDLVRREGRLLI